MLGLSRGRSNPQPNRPPASRRDRADPPQGIESDSNDACGQALGVWSKLPVRDRLLILATLIAVAALAIPRLPPGICSGDSGELQLASATLGITHAPGYPGYVSLGYLATLVPGVNPAYLVTLACLASGLIVIGLCIMMQVRLGVAPAVACLTALTLLTHPRMWWSLVAPEVYLPSLAFLAGAVYWLVRFEQVGARRDLYIAAALYGVALANRPPILFMLPFIVAAWWYGWRHWQRRRSNDARTWSWVRSLSLATACAALPGLYSIGYLYVRDQPTTPYNYIERWNQENRGLPDTTEGVGAKLHRVVWHTSAREFDYAIGNTWTGAWRKLRWVRNEFFLYRTTTLGLVLTMIVLGAWITFQRCRAALWLFVGMIVSTLAFVCAYRMWGQAADLLPMIWTATVLLGVATVPILPPNASRTRKRIGVAALVIFSPFLLHYASERAEKTSKKGDATEFVRAMDMQSLPPESVICVSWPESPVVIYAKTVLTGRTDIHVIAARREKWLDLLWPFKDRPIFAATTISSLRGYTITPFRNLWRLDPILPGPHQGRMGID